MNQILILMICMMTMLNAGPIAYAGCQASCASTCVVGTGANPLAV